MKYPAYSKYKFSGVEWLGDVPENWEVKRLKHIAQLFGRIGFRGYSTEDLVDEMEGAVTLSPSNMIEGNLNLAKCTYISWDKYHESPEIQVYVQDILIVKTGSTLGKIAHVKEVSHPMTINPQIAIFKNLRCNDRFFFYYISAPYIQDQISISNTGSTIPTMTQQTIMGYAIPNPPLPEQQAIAEFLDRETGRIDELFSKKQKLIELLKEKRTALISRAVTKGLNPNVKMKPSGVEWLGDVPEHWSVKRLKYSSNTVMGQSPSSDEYSDDSDLTPFLQGNADFTDRFPMPRIYCEKVNKIIGKGALLISVRAPVGALNEADQTYGIGRGLCAVIPQNTLLKEYSWYALQITREELNTLATGSTYDAVSTDEVGNMSFPLPPLPEQQAITDYLDRETGKIDSLVAKVEAVIEKLKEYRTALISAAVTGKIDVSSDMR